MIEVNSLLFMGLWELVLLLLAVDVIIFVRFIIRSRREKTSIERMVSIVRQDEERREKETRNLLEKKYGYSGEQLEKATKKIVREEKRIYQTLANLFTTRDHVTIENLSIIFEEVVEPYRELEVPKPVETSAVSESEEGDGSEVQRLKDLNQTLNGELRVTMNTLSKMLHEYSLLLADNNVSKDDSKAVAALIGGEQVSKADTSPVPAEDVVEERTQEVAAEAAVQDKSVEQEANEEVAEAVVDEAVIDEAAAAEPIADEASDTDAGDDIDSASLVGMFQEEDDDLVVEEAIVGTAAIGEASDTIASAAEKAQEPDGTVKKGAPVEESLAQEIGEVLESADVDLSDIELDKIDSESREATEDQVEDLLAQAIGETLESHETPLPELTEEQVEEEANAAEMDPAEALLAKAIGETLESHETPLPDFDIELLDDESDAAEVDPTEELLAQALEETSETAEAASAEPDAEKKLTDEIAKTLNGHSENMSDEDIDSLLQGAIEDTSEK